MSFFEIGASLKSLINQIDSVILPSIKTIPTYHHYQSLNKGRGGGEGGRGGGGIQPRQTNVAATPGDMALVKETEPSRCSEKLGPVEETQHVQCQHPKVGFAATKKLLSINAIHPSYTPSFRGRGYTDKPIVRYF